VFALLLALLILDGILLVVIVLMQAGKGGGLAAVGGGAGTESLIGGGRQAATVLTRATWITGGLFLGLAVVLSVLSSRAQTTTPLLQQELQRGVPTAPSPILPEAAPGAAPGEVVPGVGGQPIEEGGP
jgi:preprotein translocase subunit SecG